MNQSELRKLYCLASYFSRQTLFTQSTAFFNPTMPKFSADFYESIFEASDIGELWGIENTDLTPLELHLILAHTSIN